MDKPKLILSSQDYDRLETLLGSLPDGAFPGKQALEEELNRADVILPPQEIPDNVVTMNSTVRFAIENTDQHFCMTLVYPRDADGSADRISILAPVGSALLGLSVGDGIEWPGPGGRPVRVRIEEVVYQPERAGEYHR